ncbi:RNA methyltransferase [Arthrobacter tumbae]|uniref:TrmH family RNA methyltransferase n=1 Tax=Arthrobacter tumbae TaxID=163874 RepID=UPI00195EB566|nr:RNA methyltransferase [Arthrobacter tumbae]MBM7782772.1 TrmH family RNA methyltransferase [Arthrobacter tumbae]
MNTSERPQAQLLTNPRADRVRDVAKLAGRSARLRQESFLAEGPQAVREALRLHEARRVAGETGVVEDVYLTAETLERYPEFGAGVRPRMVTAEVLAAMSSTVTPQGAVAVCRFIDSSLSAVLERSPQLIAVLVEVRDPGNAGTILRAADSAGADAVIFTSGSVDVYNPKTVRSTVGSLFHLPVVVGVDTRDVLTALADRSVSVLAADGYGDWNLDELQDASAARRLAPSLLGETSQDARKPLLEAPTAWLFGNEAQGLAPEVLDLAGYRVSVPIYGSAESLNVGTAATVCLYASARAQRG